MSDLAAVFGGNEPLSNASLVDSFRTLIDLGSEPKPFECVGDVVECRSAVLLAAARPDRQDAALLQELAGEIRAARFTLGDHGRAMFEPLGHDHIPDAFASDDQLV